MTGCSNMPTGCKEFISRFGEIVGSATQFFPDRTASPTHAWEACPAPVPYHRPMREATIPCLDRNGVGNGFKHVFGVWNGADQGFRTHAHLFGQLQLTAWRGPDHRNVTAIRTLVGCMEFLDGIDFVTEEFDTNRMRQCWRKHVDNAASHCEFTTIHHQVDSSIRILHQSMRRLIERQLLTLGEHQRSTSPSPQPQAESGNAPA